MQQAGISWVLQFEFYILRNLSMFAFQVFLTKGEGIILGKTLYEWLIALVLMKQIGISNLPMNS